MAIENRNLVVGTRLVASYKKQTYVCTVEQGEDGKMAYVLENGRRFTSPSAAGSAVMGGTACNGWHFWSAEGVGVVAAPKAQQAATADTEASPAKPAASEPSPEFPAYKVIKRVPNQQGVPEGQVRWHCGACMKSFTVPAGQVPQACPQGHDATSPPKGHETDPQFRAGEAD